MGRLNAIVLNGLYTLCTIATAEVLETQKYLA